ncbi:glycoside hydrolase family 32 protein [Zhihengliuella sp.]|uniref:glycoside hydrolase family 32 protein n=1 Tax=Zhihengliuella sp. TaxID=1954483 RepID=UPI0028113992|nr:glycoside hydrolase family 32 protein [Zhihengliuella sp.]
MTVQSDSPDATSQPTTGGGVHQPQPAGERPAIHPRPLAGWLNDPNGILRHDGRYHVFCQYNPDSARHSSIAWAHLSSPDLLSWHEHPVAIAPTAGGDDAFGCWSGVGTVDDGVPTLVYTGIRDGGGPSTVLLARSGDAALDAWAKDAVPATGMPEGEQFTDVRDPFLFTLDGRRYGLQGAGTPGGDPAVLLYDATDLADWKYLGRLLDTRDPLAGELAAADIWECPQLFRSGGSWVLLLSLWRWVDGAHQLNSVAYLAGDLVTGEEGVPLRFAVRAGGRADTGPDFYAPQVLAETDRTLAWGWSWEGRAEEFADADGWAGLLTLPRELGLDGDALVMRPAAELEGLRGEAVELTAGAVSVLPDPAEVVVEPVTGDGADGTASADTVSADVELLLVAVGSDGAADSAAEDDGGRGVLRLPVGDGLRIYVDRTIVEVFRSGAAPHTQRFYPAPGEQLALSLPAGVRASGWALEPMGLEYRAEAGAQE